MIIRDKYLLRRSDEFHLGSGQEASINLKLKKVPPLPCTKLYGQVKSGCKPISGATVKILDKNFNPLYHTETDKDGHFSFLKTLLPGVYEIVAVADDFLVSESRLISLKQYKPLAITIKLKPDKSSQMATVYGTIRDEINVPLSDTQVYVFIKDNIKHPVAATCSNSDGEYLVNGLVPGDYSIRAFKNSYLFPESVNISLFEKEIFCADLYLYKDISVKGTISGEVLYKGIPVPYALVALFIVENNESTLVQIRNSNSEGFYLFSGLKPGYYIVKAKLKSKYKTICSNVISE